MGRAACRRLLFLNWLWAAFLFSSQLQARGPITPDQAINFAGSSQTVCGKVVSSKFLSKQPSAATFLNLDRPYPDQIFTAEILAENRGRFPYPPEVELMNKNICVSGLIEVYKGKAQIFVKEPKQINLSH